MNRKNRRFRIGFTLMELMIGAAILALALLGLLGVFSGCLGLNESAGNLTVAINGTQEKLEEIRNHNFDDIYNDYNGATFEVAGLQDADSEGSIVVDNTDPALLEIIVTLCWRERGGRIIGEDNGSGGGIPLNGICDGTEDTNGNNILDSPGQIVTFMAER